MSFEATGSLRLNQYKLNTQNSFNGGTAMWLRDNSKLEQMLQEGVDENYAAIVTYLADHDAPLDYLIAGELAQIQTFGIPSISKLLHRTKQYEEHGVKRLDDTRAILTECMMESVQSPRGAHMVKHLNWIHSHYEISNEDYLYTLALFIVEPIRWMESFGYRKLNEKEKTAIYLAFKSLGEAMNIEDIPVSLEAFYNWYHDYRQQHLNYHEDNKKVTDGLIESVKEMFPFFVKPFIKPVILTLINDEKILYATGQKPPAKMLQKLIRGFMHIRKAPQKFINPWQNNAFESSNLGQYYITYPNGYQNCALGPEKIVKGARSGCPFSSSGKL